MVISTSYWLQKVVSKPSPHFRQDDEDNINIISLYYDDLGIIAGSFGVVVVKDKV